MSELLRYEFSGGVAAITLDDGKANALSIAMLEQINAALDRAEADKAVVLLSGREGRFSGGFDLATFSRGGADAGRMLEAGARTARRLLAFPQPVVAACGGHAIAMGAFLLLSTDLRIGVDEGARIHVNEVQIGLTLPRFAVELCRQRLAPAHFNRAAITAEPYAPVQALTAGFLDELVPAAELAATARARAAAIAKLPRQAYVATKVAVRQRSLELLDEAIRLDVADWAALFLARK